MSKAHFNVDIIKGRESLDVFAIQSGWKKMSRGRVLIAGGLAGLLILPLSAVVGPDPEPPFLVKKGIRTLPGLKTGTILWKGKSHEQAEFVLGNKEVVVRGADERGVMKKEHLITVCVNGRPALELKFWGSGGEKTGYGYPFGEIPGEKTDLKIDRQNSSVTFTKPYFLPDGKRAVFSWKLRPAGPGQVELSWDLGIPQEKMQRYPKLNCSLWFGGSFPGRKILLDDVSVSAQSREELRKRGEKQKRLTRKTEKVTFSAGVPLQEFSVVYPRKTQVICSRTFGKDKGGNDVWQFFLQTWDGGRRTQDRVILDLGVGAAEKTGTPPPVRGIDFWKHDATHVPLSPTRNLMPNPSFEQGLRYWTWNGGGAKYTPSELPRYDLSSDAKFGKNALFLRPVQPLSSGLRSFPISLDRNKVYTFSFYAKSNRQGNTLRVVHGNAPRTAFDGFYKTQWYGDTREPNCTFRLTTEWKRYSKTFPGSPTGLVLMLGGSDILLDGLQLEEGDKPTDFVCSPIEGRFVTANKDNDLVKGEAMDAAILFTGTPGRKGTVDVTILNAFRETVFRRKLSVTIGKDGTRNIPLNPDPATVGEGVFVVRTDYAVDGFRPYTEYSRFSVMTPLENRHATKNLFGTLSYALQGTSRADDLAKKWMEWGFGSTSWVGIRDYRNHPQLAEFFRKYRIQNMHWSVSSMTAAKLLPEEKNPMKKIREWESVPPGTERILEEETCRLFRDFPPDLIPFVSWNNEEEVSAVMVKQKRFDEYFKLQSAVIRGAKRANPRFGGAPSSGPCAYTPVMPGPEAMEGYLAAAKRNGFRYDAIAVHPYGNIDKGTLSSHDHDVETARLIEQMKRYGYGRETPILFTECFNRPETFVPEWNAGSSYDVYPSGKPTYDFGNREFLQAASAARLFLIGMKYWPQVQSFNIWVSSPFMDLHLTPTILNKAVNTLGTHLPWVEFLSDIRPFAGVRGYAFKREDGSGVAALWCISHEVESGFARGPLISVKFGQKVEIYDLMGNRRTPEGNPENEMTLRLTPAPLLIKAKNPLLLADALRNASTEDPSSAVSVAVNPEQNGELTVSVSNLTGREQAGKLRIGSSVLPYRTAPGAVQHLPLPGGGQGNATGRLFSWARPIRIEASGGQELVREWSMDYFFVPKTSGMPDWNRIPALPVTNFHPAQTKIEKGDFEAKYRMAWDEKNLYLRVEITDDHFLRFPEQWKLRDASQRLWFNDGCLEVYFDCGANGRTNLSSSYDEDDYRYDFSVGRNGKSGPGAVWRFYEVNHQFAGGLEMPTKQEASEKIRCDFQITENGYSYTIVFGQRYLLPFRLAAGSRAGFALYIHDKDPGKKSKALTTGSRKGEHCQNRPATWPLMILKN